ncbi:MAG: hypothetical protein IT191_06025 [Microbacteriaceae bacterium]|nr:hypothetical protein [Microbacteriaceae bacterium]
MPKKANSSGSAFDPAVNGRASTETGAPRELEWWQRLGLSAFDPAFNSVNDERALDAKLGVLNSHIPVLFAVSSDGGQTVQKTLDGVVAALDRAEKDVASQIEDAARAREQRGREATASAYAATDADEIIAEGDWVGFTRANAIAWCWNLYQYEPHGFVLPNSILREQRVRKLESGGIPDGFGYADRARELEAAGTTAKEYRTMKEAQGAPTFSADDVRFSSRKLDL